MAAPDRMLVIDPSTRRLHETVPAALPSLLSPSDVVVVNDAATFPARLWARAPGGERLELRLVDAPLGAVARAVVFGEGSHLERTEDRKAPPELAPSSELDFGSVRAKVLRRSPLSPRLLWLRWLAPPAEVWRALYELGKPVQYSYRPEALPLYEVQTLFASRPFSAEMPSAARPLSFALLSALRERGVILAHLTHGAGLSATGDPVLDRALPLPERYEIPEATATQVERARLEGRRVLAVGTTVVRALESAVRKHGRVRPGRGIARLVLDEATPLLAVDGILSGAHAPEESHYRLLRAFVDAQTLARASEHAREHAYRLHEHGDFFVVLPSTGRATGPGSSTHRLDEESNPRAICTI